MVVAHGPSKIPSYSSDISQSLYVAEVSPVHKITFSEEFSLSLTIKPSLIPYGYTGCLKKSKSNGIANCLSNVFLIAFPCVAAFSAIPSDFFAPTRAFNPLAGCMSRLNVILTAFGIIHDLLNHLVFQCQYAVWVCYIWHVNLGDISFAFESKLCPMFYHRI